MLVMKPTVKRACTHREELIETTVVLIGLAPICIGAYLSREEKKERREGREETRKDDIW